MLLLLLLLSLIWQSPGLPGWQKVNLITVTRRPLHPRIAAGFRIGDADIIPTSHVTNLGVVLDQNLNMDRHISRTSKSAFFHLHNIRRISKYLDQESLLTLTHAFITSRLDYCNSLLYGAPVTQIEKLQRIQNAAARLITRSPKFCHMGPILRQLHWLPLRSRIHHKILTLTFKSIHGLAPSYLSELITTSRPSGTLSALPKAPCSSIHLPKCSPHLATEHSQPLLPNSGTDYPLHSEINTLSTFSKIN